MGEDLSGYHERGRVSNPSERTKRVVRNMRLLREKRGWSSAALSEAVALAFERGEVETLIARSVIINLENFRRDNVTLDEMVALAFVLNTSIGWLADFDGPACVKCGDNPPEGFACKACGADEDVRNRPRPGSDE